MDERSRRGLEFGLHRLVDHLPTISKDEKSAVTAFVVGGLFGSIGIGIYLRNWIDFFVPMLIFILFMPLGGFPGWLFAGIYGAFRVATGEETQKFNLKDHIKGNEDSFMVARDGVRYGPYSLNVLRQYYADGKLKDNDFLWFKGIDSWTCIKEFNF